MNVNPTLTADEFKTIHNALWDLDCLVQRLEDIVKPDLSAKLVGAVENIRKGLAGAYKQDDDAFARKNSHYESVKEELGLSSVWSLYEVSNLNERHPFKDACKVVYKDHWGDRPVECQIVGSTWAALWVAADACIRDSDDEHHVFVEQFRAKKDDPTVLILSTGS